jgi:hypothetical protein
MKIARANFNNIKSLSSASAIQSVVTAMEKSLKGTYTQKQLQEIAQMMGEHFQAGRNQERKETIENGALYTKDGYYPLADFMKYGKIA